MIHPLDPGAPLHHPDGTDFSNEERQAFFESVEQQVRAYYKSKRANIYTQQLTVGEQLDMLWHELNETGSISKDGAWFNAVKEVKTQYPKDDSAYSVAVQQVAAMREGEQ